MFSYGGILPGKGVLFLGGHPNMTKKLQKKFPKWQFACDEQMKKYGILNQKIMFYWTAHGSHKLMRYVFAKLPSDTIICYVTSTNVHKLVKEMEEAYRFAIEGDRVA